MKEEITWMITIRNYETKQAEMKPGQEYFKKKKNLLEMLDTKQPLI